MLGIRAEGAETPRKVNQTEKSQKIREIRGIRPLLLRLMELA